VGGPTFDLPRGAGALARPCPQLATGFGDAPLPYALSAAAAAVYVVAAVAVRTDRRALLAGAAAVELTGVLAVGALTLAERGAFPDETVWSRFGQGYGYVPLVLPIAALAWLAAGQASATRLSSATARRRRSR
jgi:hypothetical protein